MSNEESSENIFWRVHRSDKIPNVILLQSCKENPDDPYLYPGIVEKFFKYRIKHIEETAFYKLFNLAIISLKTYGKDSIYQLGMPLEVMNPLKRNGIVTISQFRENINSATIRGLGAFGREKAIEHLIEFDKKVAIWEQKRQG